MLLVNRNIAITAGVEQAKVARQDVSRPASAEVIDKTTQIPTAAGLDKQNSAAIQNSAISKSNQADIANEQIRVTSTIGKNQIRGNLTQHKAIEIYEKIARLL